MLRLNDWRDVERLQAWFDLMQKHAAEDVRFCVEFDGVRVEVIDGFKMRGRRRSESWHAKRFLWADSSGVGQWVASQRRERGRAETQDS